MYIKSIYSILFICFQIERNTEAAERRLFVIRIVKASIVMNRNLNGDNNTDIPPSHFTLSSDGRFEKLILIVIYLFRFPPDSFLF